MSVQGYRDTRIHRLQVTGFKTPRSLVAPLYICAYLERVVESEMPTFISPPGRILESFRRASAGWSSKVTSVTPFWHGVV